jgi:competence protein ComEC
LPTANVSPLYVRRPLPWLTGALAVGILLAGLPDAYGLYALVGLLLITLLSAALAAVAKRNLWFFITILSLAAALGFLRLRAQNGVGSNDVSQIAPSDVQLTGFVDSDVQEMYTDSSARTRRARFTMEAETAVRSGLDTGEPVSGYVDVSIPISAEGQKDAVEPPRYGDEVWIAGRLDLPAGPRNPGAYDERTTLERRGVYSRLMVVLPENWRILKVAGAVSGVLRPIFWFRERLLSHGRRALPRERAGVLNSILLGAKSEISPADRALLEKTGTVHLLATAGLHTGIVVAMLLYLLPLAGLRRRHVVVLTLASLAVYTIMAGDRPAVVRAAIMAAVYLAGMLLEREPDLSNAIALAGLGLLLANPFNLFDYGFQISFATVITLALGMKLTDPVRRRVTNGMARQGVAANVLREAARYLVTCFCVTVVAQIGSMPLIMYYFNIFTPAGLIANILIVPIVAPVIALGFAAACLGSVSPLLSLPLDWMLNVATGYILSVVRWCSGPQFGATSIGSPPAWFLILYYGVLWGWLGWWRVRNVGPRTEDRGPSK